MERLAKDKYLIFLDVDGTIFDGKGVPDKTANTLARAKACGHKIFINSGRMQCIIPDAVLERVKPDGIVGGMGTAITIGNELIFSARMDKDEVEYLMCFGEERGFFTIAESFERLVIMNGKEIHGQKNFVNSTDEFLEKYADMPVAKISFMNAVSEDDAKILKKDGRVAYVHPKYVEIPLQGCNKATGIKTICDYFGADIKQSIAMGDSTNDDDMIKFAGIGIAMGNANEYIKSIADYITSSCRDGGVADALEALIFNK
ncbi:MAG: HAD-IIB family hydrolase [Clostridia bacterium]|nr:HAD-IIB family hydrolase [Clostridia bacterium]